MRRLTEVLAACVLAIAAVGCGTDDAGDAEAQAQELRTEAGSLREDLQDRIGELQGARSQDDVEQVADDVRSRLEEGRDRLEGLELEGEEEELRDRLVEELEDVEGDVERLEEAAQDGNLVETLQRAGDVSFDELQQAIEDVEAQVESG